MKKIYLLALLCLPFIAKAQDAVLMKIKYQPNRNYKMGVGLNMKLNVNLTGDPQILQKIKDEGLTQPITALLGLGADVNTKTGPVGTDNMMPLTMDLKIDSLNVSANGKQAPIPPTISEKTVHIVGRASTDNTTMMIDSVNGQKANDSTQNQMKQMMSMMQRQIQFPATPMKPGDTFTQTIPLNLPVKGTGGNMQINAGVTYKLTRISDGKAYFDMVPKFSMSFNMKSVAVSMDGTGTGKMVYSIKDNFPLEKSGSFNMTIKVTSAKVNVDGTAVVTSSSATVID